MYVTCLNSWRNYFNEVLFQNLDFCKDQQQLTSTEHSQIVPKTKNKTKNHCTAASNFSYTIRFHPWVQYFSPVCDFGTSIHQFFDDYQPKLCWQYINFMPTPVQILLLSSPFSHHTPMQACVSYLLPSASI